MYETYKEQSDFIGMDMCRKFLEMGFTRSRGTLTITQVGNTIKRLVKVLPQASDWDTKSLCRIRSDIQESERSCSKQ